MRIEDREEYVDMVAQAVIDKMEAQDRMDGIAEMVFQRVMALQQEKARAAQEDAAQASDTIPGTNLPELEKETHDVGE